jgi:glycosyltransferase involved in cell wall biosynthesis
MKQLLRQQWGVQSLVLPNGLEADALISPPREAVAAFRRRTQQRTVISKVARWDPDKRWMLAVDTVGLMKQYNWQPLFIARGGVEAHEADVLHAATQAGLRITERTLPLSGAHGLLQALEGVTETDIMLLRSPLDADSRRLLLHASAAVLANSGHEPFGLVGLETMAVGGVACTGCSGEDYVIPGRNALVLETNDPHEFVSLFNDLRTNPRLERAIRQAGRVTARQYAWPQIVQRLLLPRLRVLATPADAKASSGA